MFSPWLIVLSFLGLASANPDFSLAPLSSLVSSGCSTTGAVSCHNTTVQTNLCCFESPGGLLLQTQFWDTSGPGNNLPQNWTVHGLWPDNCDTTFSENCDSSRDYTDITTIVQTAGQTELLAFMNDFWLNINGNNEELWAHEWATHGTCYSTLRLACIPSGSPTGTEAVAFFLTVEKLFKGLPTFNFLQQGGITPSSSKTFTLSQLTTVLQAATGVIPALDCTGSALNQISWYFNLQGSIIDGNFIAIDAPKAGSCPSTGITYPPKTGSGGPTLLPSSPPISSSSSSSPVSSSSSSSSVSSTSSSPAPTGTPGPVPPQSHISVLMSTGSVVGGLLTKGTWSTQTLATITATPSGSGFTLSTSRGSCGISSGQLICGSGLTSTFGSVTSGSMLLLTFNGSPAFSADSVPSGIAQINVFTGSSLAEQISLVFNAV